MRPQHLSPTCPKMLQMVISIAIQMGGFVRANFNHPQSPRCTLNNSKTALKTPTLSTLFHKSDKQSELTIAPTSRCQPQDPRLTHSQLIMKQSKVPEWLILSHRIFEQGLYHNSRMIIIITIISQVVKIIIGSSDCQVFASGDLK